MVKAATGLDVTRDMRDQRLSFRGDPINDRTLHSLRVIGPSAGSTLLNL